MQHIFNIAINVEDERIVQTIENNVEDKVIKLISDKVEDRICTKPYYYGHRSVNYGPLDSMIVERIDVILAENKDHILNTAAEKLAEKLSRSKVVKETILKRLEEV